MKRYLYCENEEGGMSHFEHTPEGPTSVLGWMHSDCEAQDLALMAWMAKAEIGDYYDHRLGVCIRIKDRP